MTALVCDMHRDCAATVTHIDVKGFVYCKPHGEQRKGDMRCRKLSPNEIKRLENDLTIRF